MKRVIIAFGLVFAIIAYSVTAAVCLRGWCNEITALIDNVAEQNKSGDSGKTSAAADGLSREWRLLEKKMSMFVCDEKLNSISSSVAKVPQFVSEANDELDAELESIRRQVNLLYRGELPLWYNLLHRFFRSTQTTIIRPLLS